MEHVAIIGNGISGITVARYVRKLSDKRITVISAESRHFFSRTALMYIYMGHMKYEHTKPYEDWFWEKNRIDLIHDYVTEIDTESKRLTLRNGPAVDYDKLVIATGSKSNKFGWPGQDLDGVQGLYSLQDLELMEKNSRDVNHAVIIGGGLIGVEMSEMFHSRGIHTTFLIREPHFWGNIMRPEEGALIGRHLNGHGVELKCNTQLDHVIDDGNGRCRGVVTDQGEELACQFVGLTAGVHPNLDLVKNSAVETGRGVIVNEYLETNVPDVYSAGDCAEIRTNPDERGRVEQLWYTGRMQGEALARTICGERTRYDRGIWFNSAKFYDIEYHTYGVVWPEDREGETSMYWENEAGDKCMRFVFNQEDRCLIGMNAFGIRYRHQVFERWLADNRPLEYVLTHLSEANFDPEFFKHFEADMVDKYNQMNIGPKVTLAKKKKLLGIF
ncbi:MAG: FAD-dependent oxidoreductase [Acidobacteriota bacterium]|nr:FAD-dependent oxidoreductase [Acidobacteriota bacterium]